MSSKYCELDKRLNELTRQSELMKESIQQYTTLKNKYIMMNEVNKRTYQKLFINKEHCEYVKGLLMKDWYGTSINAGKRKILLNHKVQEFHRKNETFKSQLENLPTISQLQELIKSNENLDCEHLRWCERLEMVRKEYTKLHHDTQNDLIKKIVEFTNEFLKTRKQNENDNS